MFIAAVTLLLVVRGVAVISPQRLSVNSASTLQTIASLWLFYT